MGIKIKRCGHSSELYGQHRHYHHPPHHHHHYSFVAVITTYGLVQRELKNV